MVYPIMPQQRGHSQPRGNYIANHRFPSHINRTTNPNGVQQFFKNLSNRNSSIGTLATKGLGDISKTLSNVDQVIKVVKSATPIVQEYGPMVKNLPAMYRMIKAFSQIEDDTVGKNSVENDHGSKHEFIDQETINEQEEVHSTRESTPRLYI
ncbi:MAG TPA: VrrA/YqfQ family protein [Candidatus Dormibacteraeota bacterium]|nr:VrrA/YqfQ family protein [Candidatus Dormibacteraeota bacterium]